MQFGEIWDPSKFDNSKIFLRLFQWNAGIVLIIRTIPVFCCNHHSSELLKSFCKYFFCCHFVIILWTHLSRLALSSDEFTNQQQNDNKKILAIRFQYFTYSKRLESFWLSAQFLWFIGTIKTRKSWNHRTCLGP